jgi:arsenical pump membrane protein
MMLLSGAAERAGFFDWSAGQAARAGRGNVLRLYLAVFGLGSLVTITLSLDTTALVLTPIVHGMVQRLGLTSRPFLFACCYTANTASLFLPVSNLTNLLVYAALDLDFLRFSAWMLLPGLLAVLTNGLVFVWLFRDELTGGYPIHRERFRPARPTFFTAATLTLGLVLAVLVLSSPLGLPIGPIALAGGALVAGLSLVKGWMSAGSIRRSISWGLFPLVVGLFLVVQAVQNAGLAGVVEDSLLLAAPGDGFLEIVAIAAGAGLGSNLINNIPMTVVSINGIEPLVAAGRLSETAAYAALIGTNIGPNLTIVGSLATLIWLTAIRRRGANVTAREYLAVGLVTTPPILLSAAFSLWLAVKFGG